MALTVDESKRRSTAIRASREARERGDQAAASALHAVADGIEAEARAREQRQAAAPLEAQIAGLRAKLDAQERRLASLHTRLANRGL